MIWRYVDNKPVLDHVGSAHSDEELAVLKAQAQRLIDGDTSDQLALNIGVVPAAAVAGTGSAEQPLVVTSERAGLLLDAIRGAFTQLGLGTASGNDPVFYDLVTARIISPASKLESIETLAEVGVQSASYSTIQRCLPRYATDEFRAQLTHALATHAGIGHGVLVFYDVTTLRFETDQEDEVHTPGDSNQRLEKPQITVGMLTDATGLPLSIGAFEGNRAETQTMLPMIQRLAKAYNLNDITVVADAGTLSASNKKAIVDAGLAYILGTKVRDIPHPIAQWRKQHPDQDYTDGQIWTLAAPSDHAPDEVPRSVTYYQYSWDRARRSRKGINKQLAKAQHAVDGKIPITRNRYLDRKAPTTKVNYALADQHLALAGIKGYETNRSDLTAEQVIGFHRQLFKIEQSFRMANTDLKAGPIHHSKQDAINAHLTIVMTAMACGHILEQASGIPLKRLVRTLKKYRSITLDIDGQTIHARTPIPDDLVAIIERLPKPD
ncbi:IS1634-like element IS1549 family transposase [Corynebacterium canis]